MSGDRCDIRKKPEKFLQATVIADGQVNEVEGRNVWAQVVFAGYNMVMMMAQKLYGWTTSKRTIAISAVEVGRVNDTPGNRT